MAVKGARFLRVHRSEAETLDGCRSEGYTASARPALDRIEQHSSAPAIESGFGMHRAAQRWIMLLFLALKPVLACDAHRPRYGTCVRQDNSLQPKQIQQQNPSSASALYVPLPHSSL
jgi:hypothetical protein